MFLDGVTSEVWCCSGQRWVWRFCNTRSQQRRFCKPFHINVVHSCQTSYSTQSLTAATCGSQKFRGLVYAVFFVKKNVDICTNIKRHAWWDNTSFCEQKIVSITPVILPLIKLLGTWLIQVKLVHDCVGCRSCMQCQTLTSSFISAHIQAQQLCIPR